MEKMRLIFKLTYNHAKNLAFFVFLYKSMMLAQKQLRDGKEKSTDSFFAGLVGGYLIFGNDNSVNNQVIIETDIFDDRFSQMLMFFVWQQIVLYLLSRITVGLAAWSVKKGVVPSPPPGKSFPVMAAVVWGGKTFLMSFCCHCHFFNV
jgi:peroxisomal membrane protein 4